MGRIARGTLQRSWLAFLHHRRAWVWLRDPLGISELRIMEDGEDRVTEDDISRVTEGAI